MRSCNGFPCRCCRANDTASRATQNLGRAFYISGLMGAYSPKEKQYALIVQIGATRCARAYLCGHRSHAAYTFRTPLADVRADGVPSEVLIGPSMVEKYWLMNWGKFLGRIASNVSPTRRSRSRTVLPRGRWVSFRTRLSPHASKPPTSLHTSRCCSGRIFECRLCTAREKT